MTEADKFDLRISVCIPSHGEWKAAFGESVTNMVAHFTNAKYENGEKCIDVACVTGSMLTEVRHRCVSEALKFNATHMLFLDCDMVFPRDIIQKFLNRHVPVVGANYVRRSLPTIPTAFKGGKAPEGMLYTEPGDNSLVEVMHVGTGCMFIDTRVFDHLELPFFKFETAENKIGTIGEDVYFCKKIREAGFKIYCDQEVSQNVGHIGELVHTHAMSLETRAKKEAAA